MVNFGKKLLANQIQEFDYKLMKKTLKQYVQQTQPDGEDTCLFIKEFSKMLDDQIEKIVPFLWGEHGLLARRIQELGESGKLSLRNPDIYQICELQQAYRAVGHDLLRLLRFVDMHSTCLGKILKKFDRKFHFKFTVYCLTSRSSHPYAQLQQVFKHMVTFRN